MTNAQYFAACKLLAPDFRIGVEYPVMGRSLVWHGRLTPTGPDHTAGLLFPDNSAFEPRLTMLLPNALLTLQQATS